MPKVRVPVSTNNVMLSISKKLQTLFPGIKVYNSPNMQLTDLPCFFINFIPSSSIKPNTVYYGSKFERLMKLEIIYMEQYNESSMYKRYNDVLDKLEYNMEFLDFLYYDEDDNEYSVLIRTYDRGYYFNTELHYKLTLKLHVYREEIPVNDGEYIDYMDIDVEVKELPNA